MAPGSSSRDRYNCHCQQGPEVKGCSLWPPCLGGHPGPGTGFEWVWYQGSGTVPVVGGAFDVDFPLGVQVFPGGQVLTVASAHASDAGSYSCVAVSAVGEDRRDIILQVHSESLAWVTIPRSWA